MSIYLGNQEVGVSLLTGAEPIGLDEICNHTFASGNVVYNGERIFAYTFARTPITSFYGPNVKRFNNSLDPTADGTSGACVFFGCTNLTSVTFPELLNIGTSSSQFAGCSSLVLTSTSFPKLTTFGNSGYTFQNCTSLVTIDSTIFPSLTTFNDGGHHFEGCTSLVSVSFPNVTTLGASGGNQFKNCTALTTISFPKLTTFGNGGYQFSGCSNLTTVDLPNLTTFGNTGYQFNGCSKLTTVNLPKLTGNTSGGYQFQNCTSLEHIFLPKASLQAGNCFRGCTKLKTAVFPHVGINATQMSGTDFYNCTSLEAVDIKTSRVHNNSFQNCSKMNILVLRNTAMATLSNVNAFTNTPFASGKAGGTIYVKESLISTYQANANWKTILNYQSGAQNSIKTIESTHEDPDAPIDLTLYYIDGTPIA